MSEPTNKIKCPKCNHLFELTDALAGPLLAAEREAAQKRIEEYARTKENEVVREKQIAHAEGAEAARKKFAEDMAATTLRAADAADALRNAQIRLRDQDAKLAMAQEAQAEAIRKTRELDDAKRELTLTIEKQVNAGLTEARTAARREADILHASKLDEKDKAMSELRETIAELERKATHGDNRIQGEVQELAIEKRLREAFPRDTVESVAKGVHGGDTLLKVLTTNGAAVGTILFESKDTKSWDQKWMAKLRADGRAAHADLVVLVTRTLPPGVAPFEQIDGVWVVGLEGFVALTYVLRALLFEVHAARIAGEGQETKAGLVYTYLTGGAFKRRMQALIENVGALKTALDKERAAIERQWALRSSTHDKLVSAIVGMGGDLGGIIGKAAEEIEGMSLAELGEATT